MIAITSVLVGVLVLLGAMFVIVLWSGGTWYARAEQAGRDLATLRERIANRDAFVVELQHRLAKAERTAGLVVDQLASDAGLLREPTFARSNSATGAHGALPKLMAGLGLNEIHKPPGPREGGIATDH